MKLAIILVNFNGLQYNEPCLHSILNSDWNGQITVYVVDNGSTDGSMEALEGTAGTGGAVRFLYLGENRGFSAANNVGIRRALEDGADSVMLLNNDTVICRDMLAEMVDAQRKYGTDCIFVPKICYYDRPDVIWSAGGGFTGLVKKPFSYGENKPDDGTFDSERQCENGNGCCMLLSRQVIERLGFLDERFFLYYEDTEYFLRAGECGVSVYYVPTAKLYHKVNGSTKGNDNAACVYYITRNWLICHSRHLHGIRFGCFLLYFLANRAAWMGIWMARGKFVQAGAIVKGIRDFLSGKSGKY